MHSIDFLECSKAEQDWILAEVKKNPCLIQYLTDPSEKVQLEAVRQNGFAIKHLTDPSEKVKLAAVKQDGFAIEYLTDPSEEVKLVAKMSSNEKFIYFFNKQLFI